MQHAPIDIHHENRTLGDLSGRLFVPGLVVGIAGIGVAAAIGVLGGDAVRLDRFFQAYLVTYMFFLAITLAGLFFVILHHVTRAGWSTVVRRLAEGISTNGIWMLVLTPAWLQQGWLHAKLLFVLGLTASHMVLARWRKDFEADRNTRSQRVFRIVNEVPTLLMIGIVIFVIVKPF